MLSHSKAKSIPRSSSLNLGERLSSAAQLPGLKFQTTHRRTVGKELNLSVLWVPRWDDDTFQIRLF